MNTILVKKVRKILFLCLTFFFALSCKNETVLIPTQISTEEQMAKLVEKVANSSTYKALLSEIANINILSSKKKLVIKPVVGTELYSKINSSRNLGELEVALAENFSEPSLVIGVIEKFNVALKQLDKETHFSALSTEKRKELMKRVLEHSSSKEAFMLTFSRSQNAQARIASDCGGICNNAYYRTIEAAAKGLIAATVVAFGSGILGGPVGMAAGTLAIGGAIFVYWWVEEDALETLGDCFDGCKD